MNRPQASVFSVVTMAIVLSPVVQNFAEKPRDDFPLSYFPMFSRSHPDVQEHTSLVGVTADGECVPIHYTYYKRGGMNQVRKQIRRAVRRGEDSALEMVERVAGRIARRDDPDLRDLVEIRAITGEYDVIAWFTGGERRPLSVEVHAAAPVIRDVPDGDVASAAEESTS